MTQKFKIVVSDIDGTLITDSGDLLDSTIEAVNQLTVNGIRFATASARTIKNTIAITEKFANPCSAYALVNGTYVIDSDGKIIDDSPLDTESIEVILSLLDQSKISYCCLSVDSAASIIRHELCRKIFALFHTPVITVETAEDITFKTYIIAAYGPKNVLRKILMRLLKNRPDIDCSPPSFCRITDQYFTFIQRKWKNKGTALRQIAKHLNIAPKSSVAIGDGIWNDTSLLLASGYPVAMTNASESLKKIARQQTPTDNNNDGVGKFIRNFFLTNPSHEFFL